MASNPYSVGSCSPVTARYLSIEVATTDVLTTPYGVIVRPLNQQRCVLTAVNGNGQAREIIFKRQNMIWSRIGKPRAEPPTCSAISNV